MVGDGEVIGALVVVMGVEVGVEELLSVIGWWRWGENAYVVLVGGGGGTLFVEEVVLGSVPQFYTVSL